MSDRQRKDKDSEIIRINNNKKQVLTGTHLHKAIDCYINNKSDFSENDSAIIRSVLLNKLISSNPLGLFAVLCKLSQGPTSISDLSKILEKKGGSVKTVYQWMEELEKLGYVTHVPSNIMSKYKYSLNINFHDIFKELPPFYHKMIEENAIKDYVFSPIVNVQREVDGVIDYINNINDKLSFIIVENKNNEVFESTKIIKTLLDCGATISEAFFVLEEVSKELEYIYKINSTRGYLNIRKEDIPKLIKTVLRNSSNPKMDHLIHWYSACDLIRETGIKHNEDAAKLIKKEILGKKWKTGNSTVVYFEAFETVYGCNLETLKDKSLFLNKIDHFITEVERFNNTFSSCKKTAANDILVEYCELTRNIALGILISIGRLGSNKSLVGNLRNVLKVKQSAMLEVNDLINISELISTICYNQNYMYKFIDSNLQKDFQIKMKMHDKLDKNDILFKRELIKEINSIITNYDIYDEIKDQIDISPVLQKLINENKNDYKYVNRIILDEFFSNSIKKNSINKKIRSLQSSKDYNNFIKSLEFSINLESKLGADDDIEIPRLIYNLQAIKSIYQIISF